MEAPNLKSFKHDGPRPLALQLIFPRTRPALTMVLEEVSSDPDLYSSYDEPPTSTVQIPQTDISRLPSPIAFSAAWGFTAAKLQRGIAAERATAETLLERPVTSEEADALSYYFAKGYRYASYGTPIGAVAGSWRAVTTADEMRWPVVPRSFSKWSRWNFDKETQSLTFAGRQLAKGAWLRPTIIGLKGIIYVNVGIAIGGLLSSSYAASVTAVGGIRDPRLKAFHEKILDRANKKGGGLDKPTPPPRAGATQGRFDPMGQGERTAGELWKNHRRAIGRRDDDASPTAGNDDFYNDEAERPGGNDSMLTDSQIQAQQQRQQPSQRGSPTDNRASTFQMEKTERQPRSFSDDFDMTSPSAEDQPPTSSTSSGESAWDRVRRENSTVSASTYAKMLQKREQQKQQEGSTPGESFTFSSADSERAYAKDEAQKHFDERVEQERRGEDFGSGRSKRW